jgi:hypothetical protein
MNLYPDQLRKIADLCEALDKAEGEQGMYLEAPHRVIEDDCHLGELRYEIGGSYSFFPVTTTKENTK